VIRDHAAAVPALVDERVHALDVLWIADAVEALASDVIVLGGEVFQFLLSELLALFLAEQAVDVLDVRWLCIEALLELLDDGQHPISGHDEQVLVQHRHCFLLCYFDHLFLHCVVHCLPKVFALLA